jgi:hypothetical protein
MESPQEEEGFIRATHLEDLPPPNIKEFFLVYVFHGVTLGTKI